MKYRAEIRVMGHEEFDLSGDFAIVTNKYPTEEDLRSNSMHTCISLAMKIVFEYMASDPIVIIDIMKNNWCVKRITINQ